MKKHLLIVLAFVGMIILPGCYTVIWSPETPLPDNNEYVTNYYYINNYYGDYYYFYDTPWWIDHRSPVSDKNPVRTGTIESLRNPNGGRNTPERPVYIQPGIPSRPHPVNPPPVSTPSPQPKAPASQTSSTSTSSRSSSDKAHNELRNNDGNRNTDNRRHR